MRALLFFFNSLKERWEITSNFQFFLIMLVFAITGSLSLIIADLLMPIIVGSKEIVSFFKIIIRVVFIFPIYQFIILIVAFCFGQFKFFWKFEKKMLMRIFKKIK
tara:strand:+ start:622 stop:936 length:315 start_codon:yes stop_codon:yes gene_type:complete